MIDGFQLVLVILTAVACGLMGGAFYAFSAFVMAGFKRMPSEQGMAAMQAVNLTAVRPPFMLGFFGTTLLCVAVVVWALVDWEPPASTWLLIGAGCYLLGIFLMTAVFHVPRNNALAATDPADPDAGTVWSRYLTEWTAGNHVRTLAGAAAATGLTIALVVG